MNVQMIPIDALHVSDANVRKSHVSIDGLKESIQAHGLLQPLLVTSSISDDYYVVDGQRRLISCRDLGHTEVACMVIDPTDEAAATELSLAANSTQLAMHPADQVEAFGRLAQLGMTPEAIANHFGITKATVERRLALGGLSASALALWRADRMDMEAAKRMTLLSPDEQRELIGELEDDETVGAYDIQNHFVRDRRVPVAHALFKIELYEKKGGRIIRDLFDDEESGYFEDKALFERLQTAEVTKIKRKVAKEGWKDVQVRTGYFSTGYMYGWVRVKPVTPAGEGEDPDHTAWDPEQRALCTAFIQVECGNVKIHRGWIDSATVQEQRQAAEAEKQAKQAEKLAEVGVEAAPEDKSKLKLDDDLLHMRTLCQRNQIRNDSGKALRAFCIQGLCAHAGGLRIDRQPLSDWARARFAGTDVEEIEKMYEKTAHDGDRGYFSPGQATAYVLGLDLNGVETLFRTLVARSITTAFSGLAGSLFQPLRPEGVRECWTPDFAYFSRLTKAQMKEIVDELAIKNVNVTAKKDALAASLAGVFANPDGWPSSAEAIREWVPAGLCVEPEGDPIDDLVGEGNQDDELAA